MPVERMKMRPWLEKMIESRSISGLVWSDKAKTMFTIPWKHAARQGWELDKDARLFKQWAIHTGKYVEGQTTDPKTWKANFRCAMNSLPDIKEVKDRSVHKGNHAVRVFKMLPATHKDKRSKVKERKSRKKSSVKVEEEAEEEEEEEEKSDTHSAADTSMSSTQEDTIDSTVPMGLNDLTSILSDDVPEWSLSVEVGGMDFPFQHRFEVSPDHNSDHIFTEEMIEICHQLEKDSNWTAVGSGGKDFLSSEACSSPGSQTSYSSSEPDEMPQYINLDSEFTCSTNEFWSSFAKPFPSL